jgi:hypothetical protein
MSGSRKRPRTEVAPRSGGNTSEILIHEGRVYLPMPQERVDRSALLSDLTRVDATRGASGAQPHKVPVDIPIRAVYEWASVAFDEHAARYDFVALVSALQVRHRCLGLGSARVVAAMGA